MKIETGWRSLRVFTGPEEEPMIYRTDEGGQFVIEVDNLGRLWIHTKKSGVSSMDFIAVYGQNKWRNISEQG